MAEKHKSKYKAPKDLEKSQKPKTRKDLKDYTTDDKDGGLNPKSTKDKQLNVLRKTDKTVQDDGKLYPTYNADDRLYKDIEEGDYDPKTAAKRLKKRQDAEEKDVKDVLKDKIENLTREQKERLVREYVRRKIANILREQAEPEEEPAADTDIPAPEPGALGADAEAGAAPEAGAEATPGAEIPAADPGALGAEAPDASMAAAPAPDASMAAAPAAAAAVGAAAGADAEATPAQEPGPEERQTLNVSKIKDVLSAERSNLSRIETLFKGINQTFKDADPIDIKNFYRLMLRTIAKNYKKITDPTETK
jgi:hypothetical protein